MMPALAGTMSAEPGVKRIEPASRMALIWSAQILGARAGGECRGGGGLGVEGDVDHRLGADLGGEQRRDLVDDALVEPPALDADLALGDLGPALLERGQRLDAGEEAHRPALGEPWVEHAVVDDPVVAEERGGEALDRGARGLVLHRAGEADVAVEQQHRLEAGRRRGLARAGGFGRRCRRGEAEGGGQGGPELAGGRCQPLRGRPFGGRELGGEVAQREAAAAEPAERGDALLHRRDPVR